MPNDEFLMTNERMAFNKYTQELIEWNKKFNLTAITDPDQIQIKHFEDSLALLQAIKLTNQTIIDIGTGAGLPGIPLKIICPEIKLTLLEATKKKTEFLKHVTQVLELKNVAIVWTRAEEYAQYKIDSFDLAVARAVAKTNVLTELCLPFVKIGGLFIAYKEDLVEEEVNRAGYAIKILGGKLEDIKKVKVGDMIRSLVMIKKVAPTPAQFPRRPGLANKNPL